MAHDHDIKSLYKKLDSKKRFNLSAVISAAGASGVFAASSIDGKLWKYSILSWSALALSAGLFGVYKNISYENKIKVSNLCNKIGSYFL